MRWRFLSRTLSPIGMRQGGHMAWWRQYVWFYSLVSLLFFSRATLSRWRGVNLPGAADQIHIDFCTLSSLRLADYYMRPFLSNSIVTAPGAVFYFSSRATGVAYCLWLMLSCDILYSFLYCDNRRDPCWSADDLSSFTLLLQKVTALCLRHRFALSVTSTIQPTISHLTHEVEEGQLMIISVQNRFGKT